MRVNNSRGHHMTTLRSHWSRNEATIGAWLSIPSIVSAELAARTGFDYVCLDNQHGALDYQVSVAMIQAVLLGGSRPIVRTSWNEPGTIAKFLDAGAEGIIVPMVNTADEADAVVRSCRYPPHGTRSYGPTLVGMRHDDYFAWSNDSVAVIPMIETVRAIANLDAILAVPSVDAIYVGPADLSVSLGLPPRNNDGHPAFDEALATIAEGCRNAGVVAGIHASAALVARRLEQGFRMVTVTADVTALRQALVEDLSTSRGIAALRNPNAIY